LRFIFILSESAVRPTITNPGSTIQKPASRRSLWPLRTSHRLRCFRETQIPANLPTMNVRSSVRMANWVASERGNSPDTVWIILRAWQRYLKSSQDRYIRRRRLKGTEPPPAIAQLRSDRLREQDGVSAGCRFVSHGLVNLIEAENFANSRPE
jgi:hypothetical protein